MLKREFWRKAQSMAEYAVIIAAVAAAIAAMGIFFKAGLQKRLFNLATELNDRPYIPRMTVSTATGGATTNVTESYRQGISHVVSDETTSRHSDETVVPETQ